MHDLNGFERDALYCLAGLSKPNGNEIREQLAEYYDTTIYDNRLYPALKSLNEKGLVNVAADGRSKRYSVTRRGTLALEERRRWENTRGDLEE
jgi:DNA-binding PadR family transcriptional regulator